MPYEVTFRIVRPQPWAVDDPAAVVASCAAVLREAAGIPEDSLAWLTMRDPLVAGGAVRVRMAAEQLCRFFLRRREAGRDVVRRLKWSDAVEVQAEVPARRRRAA